MNATPWWRGAVIYQVYPRSFLDTNGVGDLNGIVERLEYIASLGVDAIWIAPFFKSPMHDLLCVVQSWPHVCTCLDMGRCSRASHESKASSCYVH